MPGEAIDTFIAQWRDTGGSELANTQSFINGLCALIGVAPPQGSRTDDALNDYVFERRVFQDNGDGTTSFGRIDVYKRGAFILEAKQGSGADAAAEAEGRDDIDIFGQTAAQRMKRGTAKRGTPSWSKAMVQAKGQAERYAKALPADHGWPPFLLVADIGHCIEVYADFTGTGKAYAQFPDRASYRIMLDDLRDGEVRERLKAIWDDPKSLDPTARAARATRDIADLLAALARRLEARGNSAERVSAFLSRLLFTMFAEDTGLIPRASFSGLLKSCRDDPSTLARQLPHLWQAMDKGDFSPALGVELRTFNGYLFKERDAIEVDAQELEVLIAAAAADWTQVEPAIFGTLLERALNPKERARLGAHYTPRAYVERLVMPTVIEPLRADWNGVRAAAAQLIDAGKAEEARRTVEQFHTRLAQTRVLDPACGTGNFLYVAMARMKELEGEVLELLEELGDRQYLAELSGHTITPENFLGIEINPRAAAIAQLVLWIGYLQWHFRVAGRDADGRPRMPSEPILKDIRTIENRDALIEWDARVLEHGENGRQVTRWDGETMKPHPVTGKPAPDETARVEVYRYVNPRPARWPKADFIVGNPPFIGNKRMRERLGDGYFEALRRIYPALPGDIDFVIYWWALAAELVGEGKARRSGLITTNTLRQSSGQSVIGAALQGRRPVSVVFAAPDHPWRDAETDAAVRVAMTVVAPGNVDGELVHVANDADAAIVGKARGRVHADLSVGAALTNAVPLNANRDMCFMGVKLAGEGFRLTVAERESLIARGTPVKLLPRLVAGADITRRPQNRFVIDVFGMTEGELKSSQPILYQHLHDTVRPGRLELKRKSYRDLWWVFAEPRPNMRRALRGLSRAIVTSEVSKHATFVFVDLGETQFDGSVIVISSDDAAILGVLSSRFHELWKLRAGGRMGVGNDPRYQSYRVFDPFPFPAELGDARGARIAGEAEALDSLRKRVLSEHPDLTLTGLYNVLDALRSGRPLRSEERDIHDRGLVTLIKQHHDAIDALVTEAYGWPTGLPDEEILVRLVALNKERAAEEANGLVRWLRPEFQAPGDAGRPADRELELGEAAPARPSATILPWPKSLPEQVSAVAGVLAIAGRPLPPQEVAKAFAGKRASTVTPVLDALAAIGQARRLEDGRYAA